MRIGDVTDTLKLTPVLPWHEGMALARRPVQGLKIRFR